MPIVKIPQKHKFGIVSLTRVQQLLALSDQLEEKSSKRVPCSFHEINQSFVEKYNAWPADARESMDAEIYRALQHAKFRAGLGKHSNTSTSSAPSSSIEIMLDVTPYDTSIAWLELALLCQCNGPLQQDVLLILSVSLNHAPLSTAHIPSLIYVAGLCYQWLKNDEEESKGLLRTGEIILLKILFFITLRLYYHHLTGCLMDVCTREEIRQLKYDLEGFENNEKVYRHLPETMLHWKFALEVGLIVCEQYSKSVNDMISAQSASSADPLDIQKTDKVDTPTLNNELPSLRSTSNTSHGGSNISSILWHSLDIWQCTKHRSEVLKEAIEDLFACSTEFEAEKWMEGVIAMNILCTTSQLNLDVLKLIQSLAAGHTLPQSSGKATPQSRPTSCSPSTAMKTGRGTSGAGTQESLLSPYVKGTRFLLPSQAGASDLVSSKKTHSTQNKVATLNVLGMQPDFNVADAESIYTAEHTVTSCQTKEESNQTLREKKSASTKAASISDIKFVQNRFPHLIMQRHPSGATLTFNSGLVASSVGTQSLIANESIPDPLPSTEVSNVTMMEMGSIMTLDPSESLGKSIGLFASSTSKNLEISISNLVSPGLMPSGDLTSSREDFATSTVPKGLEEQSVGNDLLAEELKEEDQGAQGGNGQEEENVEPTGKAKKFVEVKWESTKKPTQSLGTSSQDNKDTTHYPHHPQHIKLVISGSEQSMNRPESQVTHFTHSTAPLAEGAKMLGSQVHPSTVLHQSIFSNKSSRSSPSPKELCRFEDWPLEVALSYTLCMGSICIYGKTSQIQQTALEGPCGNKAKGSDTPQQHAEGMSLLELAGYGIRQENGNKDEGKQDDSYGWQIRHGAVLGLSRVNKTCRSLPMKDGLSDVAWAKLAERQALERNASVLQAFSLTQVVPDLDKVMVSWKSLPIFSPLLASIADGLSDFFLPPTSNIKLPQKLQKPGTKISKHVGLQPRKKIALESIKSKVRHEMIKPRPSTQLSFNARTSEALNKIAMKDLQKQLQEEQALEQQDTTT